MCTCQCPDKWEQPRVGAVFWSQVCLLLSPPCGTWGTGAVLGFFWSRLPKNGCVGEAGLVCGIPFKKQKEGICGSVCKVQLGVPWLAGQCVTCYPKNSPKAKSPGQHCSWLVMQPGLNLRCLPAQAVATKSELCLHSGGAELPNLALCSSRVVSPSL